MYMLEIITLENGAHNNQTYHDFLPEGWAIIPDELGELENFPFGEVEIEEIDGVPTVKTWIPGVMPKVTLVELGPPPPTYDERLTVLEETSAAIEDALCEIDTANEERFASIEDALCELDMGGNV